MRRGERSVDGERELEDEDSEDVTEEMGLERWLWLRRIPLLVGGWAE